MILTMHKSKIHRATVTDKNIEYEGSITIDLNLMKKANILPYEMVQVVNVNNGERFETYVIQGVAGKGDICLNGAAARLAEKGDKVIIITYCQLTEAHAREHKPIVVSVDSQNIATS